jgi:nucleoside-diphosphate-sugar epimerase
VLVTGASGYLASRLVPALAAGCRDVRLMSRRKPSYPSTHRYFAGSPDRDLAVLREAACDAATIFHLAGQTSVAQARRDPAADVQANIMGMVRLLEAVAGASRPPTIVFAGTVTEAGIPDGETLDERVPDRPITEYDIHKLAAEKHLAAAAMRGVVRGVTLRLANVYGPGTRSLASDRGVLNEMIRRAGAGDRITVFGVGKQLRDFTFIDDIVRAFLFAAERAAAVSGRFFVVGSGHRRTFADTVAIVARQASARHGRPVEVVQVDPPPTQEPIDMRSYVVDASAFRNATGWAPTVSLEDGIERTLDWIAEGARV